MEQIKFRIEEDLKKIVLKNKFFETLDVIVENFKIHDNVFGFSKKDQDCREIKEGFYVEHNKVDDKILLREKFDISKNLVRVKENGDIFLGSFYSSLKDIPQELKENLTINLKKQLIL